MNKARAVIAALSTGEGAEREIMRNSDHTWQSISTMPRSGKKVLVYGEGVYLVVNHPPGHAIGNWKKINGKWYGGVISMPEITHWMPLPKRPSHERP